MLKTNRVIIFIIAIMIICLDINYSYSREKPSEIEIRNIIILLEKNSKLLPIYIKNVKYNSFDITNSFISPRNGRYCIKVNLDLSYEGRKSTLDDFKSKNITLINKKYSFIKKHNQWFGYEGWGPGED